MIFLAPVENSIWYTRNIDSIHNVSKCSEYFSGQNSNDAAFHVYMSKTHCYHLDSALAFDIKPVDVGGGFSHDNIIYDVPFAGTYVFTWTITAWPISGKIVTELYHNDRAVGVLTSDPDVGPVSGNGIHPATGVVVVKANASDHFYIVMKDAPPSACGGDVLSDDTMVRSSFSGWLLSSVS